jgi:hypothetical protein
MHGLARIVAAVALLGAVLQAASGATQPQAVLGKAKLVVSAKVGNGFYAHVWLSPSSTGGQCRFVTKDTVARPTHPATFENGGCSAKGAFDTLPPSEPINAGVSIAQRPHGAAATAWAPPIVSGYVANSLNASKVAISWNGGSLPLVLRDGVFVGGGGTLYTPPLKNLPYKVVAYDRKGKVVASQELDGASLELMNPQRFDSAYARFEKSGKR